VPSRSTSPAQDLSAIAWRRQLYGAGSKESRGSRGKRRKVAPEERKARDVIGHSLKTDFGLSAGDADHADIALIQRRLEVAEDIFNLDPHTRTFGVGGFPFRGQRSMTVGAIMNVRRAALCLQAPLLYVRTIGAAGPSP
jgi:hypothetical protein